MTNSSPARNPRPGSAVGKKSWITRRPRKVLAPKTGWRHAVPRLRTSLWVLLAGALLAVAGFGVLYATVQVPLPKDAALAQSTVLYYSDGKTVLARVGEQNREIVDENVIPPWVKAAAVAAEDRNFYNEPGVSVTGMLRAVKESLTGGSLQGGSTITQQYVKNAYLTSARTASRKMKEIVIAMKLTQTTSKETILADYLNTIWFGRGASGIQAASRAYFGTTVDKLTVSQGAVLAAIIQQPGNLEPTKHHDALVARWHYVVNGMVTDGALTQAAADKLAFPARFAPLKQASAGATGPERFVQDAVLAQLDADGISDSDVQTRGLQVITTVDHAAQLSADKAENDVVQEAVKKAKKKPASALISIEPGTGRVKAMYGGAEFASGGDCSAALLNCTNLATQITRAPGSTFKAFVLSTYLGQPAHTIDDKFNGPEQTKLKDGQPVKNDAEGETCNNCTLVEAMAGSINTIFEPLAESVGPQTVADQAHVLGIPRDVKLSKDNFTGPSIALGTYDVHPIDMATAYATFAANGVEANPYFVELVKDADGKTIFKAKNETFNVLPPDVAANVDVALQAVVTDQQRGTGKKAALDGNRPVAGKTGTTEGNRDAWFVGYTPQLATAIWVGNIDNTSTKGQFPQYPKGLYGGDLPAMTFKAYMDGALKGQPVKGFPAPPKTQPSPSPSPSSSSSTSASTSPSPTLTTLTSTPTPSATVSDVPSSPPPPVSPTDLPSPSDTPSQPPSDTATATPPAAVPGKSAAAASPAASG